MEDEHWAPEAHQRNDEHMLPTAAQKKNNKTNESTQNTVLQLTKHIEAKSVRILVKEECQFYNSLMVWKNSESS